MLQKIVSALFLSMLVLPAMGKLRSVMVADGFERPVWAGMPPGENRTLWVIEQEGIVWSIDLTTGNRSSVPVLDISRDVSRKGNEQGLLGLAFSPEFAKSKKYYVNFTDNNRFTRIVRFVHRHDGISNLETGEDLLRIKQPRGNHNGGWIDFGPDKMLYIATGDGGSANDPDNHGQRLDSLLGKILRIDVSPAKGYSVPKDNPFARRTNAKPEIWAYGLRNPWRCSFDRNTGDLWIGDVGQNHWEEINYMPAGKGSAANYGWRLREGLIATPKSGIGGPAPRRAIEPIHVYSHGSGPTQGLSVTGGYVHRGNVKSLQGRYIFADYQNPRIWSFQQKRGKATDFQDHTDELQPEGGRIRLISSFAEDNIGNLYLIDFSGTIYRIIES